MLHVGTLTRRKFSDDDIRLLQLVADRSALAIEHARLFERERAIAEAVQRSLLPDRLPALPGMAVAPAICLRAPRRTWGAAVRV